MDHLPLQTFWIRSAGDYPYANQALEKYLLEQVGPGQIFLYLWQNQRTVVIGKNQNPWRECKVAELEADGGFLARRISGGGAVYHDLGNLNFTFLCRADNYDVGRNLQVMIAALARLGIEAEISGRNDVTVAGRKISGNAFYVGRSCFHHGTLLIGVELERMGRYLQASTKKLASKGVSSVRSRVANLQTFCPGLTPDRMVEPLLQGMEQVYGSRPVPFPPERLDARRLAALTQAFADPDWRLGRSIPCDLQLEERFPWGEVELRLSVDCGRVRQTQLFTDALHTGLADRVEQALLGQPFSSQSLAQALTEAGEQRELADLAAWIQREGF